ALPTATKAVGGHGHLLGVQRFTVGALKQKAPVLYRDLASHPPSSKGVCVVAFGGTFRASEVSDARGRLSGRLAVVVSFHSDSVTPPPAERPGFVAGARVGYQAGSICSTTAHRCALIGYPAALV